MVKKNREVIGMRMEWKDHKGEQGTGKSRGKKRKIRGEEGTGWGTGP